jgi:hypothetical protein
VNDQPLKPPPSADETREARLAKALRDNLRRRKAGSKPATPPTEG